MVNLMGVRAKVNDLLRLAEVEHELEKTINLVPNGDYTQSHKTGELATALSIICLHVPQARDRLDKMVSQKEQFIANLQKKR